MQIPNLIIAGVPKSGTTSLHNWLAKHPQAYGSPVKETYFLEDDASHMFKAERNLKTLGAEGYATFFPNVKEEHLWVFESTPNYLYQERALEYFKERAEKPLIIFSFRNPTERILSQYNYNLYTLGKFSKEVSLADFIDFGLQSSATYIEIEGHRLLNPIEANKYSKYLKVWLESFAKEQFVFLDFEQIKQKPKAVLCKLSDRLAIEKEFWSSFEIDRSNPSDYNRSTKLYHLLNKVAKKQKALMPLTNLIQNWNTLPKPELQESDLQKLRGLDPYFSDWNKELSELTNLDLSGWSFKK